MSKTEFDEFVEKNVTVESSVDWETRRDEWLEALDELYQQIEEVFLAEYIKEKKMTCNRTEKTINEAHAKRYTAPMLNIQLGGHQVTLEPIGTNILGARGRVDLSGSYGNVKLIWVEEGVSKPETKIDVTFCDKQPSDAANNTALQEEKDNEKSKWEWKIVTPPPRIVYFELNQNNFLDAFMEVVGG